MVTSKRTTKRKQTDGTFAVVEFRDLKKGDEFLLFEDDGEPVDKGRLFTALSNAYPPPPVVLESVPENAPWGIQVDDHVSQLEGDP